MHTEAKENTFIYVSLVLSIMFNHSTGVKAFLKLILRGTHAGLSGKVKGAPWLKSEVCSCPSAITVVNVFVSLGMGVPDSGWCSPWWCRGVLQEGLADP